MNELIEDWFEDHTISILNIYVLALIIIENNKDKDKSKVKDYLEETLEDVLNFLLDKGIINQNEKDITKDGMIEEKETLENFKELLFEFTNNPNLLQKDKFIKKEENGEIKLLLCRPTSLNNFKFGQIKK